MLSQMRKHAGSWMIKVLLFAIVVVFTFWGVGSFNSSRDSHVAEVNGEKISYDLYRQSYNNLLEQYRRIYGGQLDDEMLKILNLRDQALDQLVQHVLLIQEAERLKITVSDEEVAETIRQYPAFQSNGAFDKNRYTQLLNQVRMSPEAFENDQQQSLRLQKVQSVIQGGVVVSDVEARQWYDWFHTEVDLNFILFAPDRYAGIVLEDEEVKAHFESNREDYKTEPSVKVRYLHFDPRRYRDDVHISDDQIERYYESRTEEFITEKTVEASHILFKLDASADEETVAAQKAKALEVYKLAAAGQDFAELARTYSEGPTRDRGGNLGAFRRDDMVQPFGDRAFSMQAGEISEPVRTEFGWHLIKVDKVNEGGQQSLDTVRDTIREKLISEQTMIKALAHAETVYDNVFDGDNLEEAGATYNVPVETTDFFTRSNAPLAGIGNPGPFVDTAFRLEITGISAILDVGNGFCMLQVVDRQEAAYPAFETVAVKAKADLIQIRQNDRAKADAETLLAAVQNGEKLEKAVEPYAVKIESTGFFKRTGSIPTIGYNPTMIEEAFSLSDAKPFAGQVFNDARGWYVIILKDRRIPSGDGFEAEKATLVSQLTQQKRQDIYQQWLADVKTRSSIDINRKLIE